MNEIVLNECIQKSLHTIPFGKRGSIMNVEGKIKKIDLEYEAMKDSMGYPDTISTNLNIRMHYHILRLYKIMNNFIIVLYFESKYSLHILFSLLI